MGTALTDQSDSDDWFDDLAIEPGERLLRICKTPWQITFDQGTQRYILSNQVFAALGPGCSVELCSVYEEAGHSVDDRVGASPEAYAALTISVGQVRATPISTQKDATAETLGVAFTPIAPEKEDGPNPFHADIFPRTKDSANKALTRAATVVVELDQARAAEAYARRKPTK